MRRVTDGVSPIALGSIFHFVLVLFIVLAVLPTPSGLDKTPLDS